LLGLGFAFGGIMGLINLGTPLPEMPEPLNSFNTGLAASGYFFPLLKVTETVCALMLLSGMWVPLALVILAPIILNIFLVHAIMAPEGLTFAIVLGLLEIYLAFFAEPYASKLRPLFQRK